MRTPRARSVTALSILVVIAAFAAGCSSGGGASAGAGAGAPTVSDAWVRPPMGADRPGAAYLTIVGGSDADALIGASSPASPDVQVHETMAGGSGMMGMQEVDRIEIGAGATVTFEPGGYHLMLMEPDMDQLVVGETVDITLTFEHGGDVTVSAEVRAG